MVIRNRRNRRSGISSGIHLALKAVAIAGLLTAIYTDRPNAVVYVPAIVAIALSRRLASAVVNTEGGREE